MKMETITFQGRRLRAYFVNEVSTAEHYEQSVVYGHEELYRDLAGRYYFQRETYKGTDQVLLAREEPQEHHYRCEVRVISLQEALLWELGDSGYPGSRKLHRDVQNLFKALIPAPARNPGVVLGGNPVLRPAPLVADPQRTNYALNAAKPAKPKK